MEAEAESHMISAAAFVEGGIQEAYGEACSICLEEFCDGDPSVVIYQEVYPSFCFLIAHENLMSSCVDLI